MEKQEKKIKLRRKGKSINKVDYKNLIKNKNVPILTLDERWHLLFPEENKTSRIKELEQKVNKLLKQQGKLGADIKDMKKLKKNLMDEIVLHMNATTEKKLNKNKQFIEELNQKLTNSMEELSNIPYEIKEANQELVIESIKICYERLEDNKDEISQIGDWIAKMREELKGKILAKQDLEIENTNIYSYMHDILGPDLMEVFDRNRA